MNTESIKSNVTNLLKKWWVSLLLAPYIFLTIHQFYLAVRYNVFYAVNYDFPFPLNIVHIFIDTFLLIVHEAGHTFFSILGIRFITILAGSLFQILLPLAILAYFRINRKNSGFQFSLFFVGYSFLDVALYASDGGARQLPLIGGLGKESHDWHNLLTQMDLLDYDLAFGLLFAAIGIFFYGWALTAPLLKDRYENVDLELSL